MSSPTLLTESEIDFANEIVSKSPDCVQTPLIRNVERLNLGIQDVEIHLKMENCQITGSFKIRGVVSQLAHIKDKTTSMVTMSAGNYGKAFAYACDKYQMNGVVAMPTTAPESREHVIKGYNCDVVRVPSRELMKKVKELEEQGFRFLHPFDDRDLIAGYTSVGIEINQEVEADIVLVCCGGGGILAGVAAGIRRCGNKHTKIYGVEPETADTMRRSLQTNQPCTFLDASSLAAGLAPPFAGSTCFEHVRNFVEDVLTVTDEQLVRATQLLCHRGFYVEVSGAAAFAALMFNKVPDVSGKVVVAVLTGSNASPSELDNAFKKFNL